MLSRWEVLAHDEEGRPLSGGLLTTDEIRVEIRRNWLYVDDETAWVPGGAFAFPTVLTVESGELQYRDVHIQATRGPQDGIYVVVHYVRYPDPTSGVAAESRWMFGCGVYGWAVQAATDDHVCRSCEYRRQAASDWDPRDCPHNGRSVHVGVETASRSFLRRHVRSTDFPTDPTADEDPIDLSRIAERRMG